MEGWDQEIEVGKGWVQDREKPVLFSMARLDNIKNLTSLAEWFGANERLRNLVNLVIVGGVVDPQASHDKCGPPLGESLPEGGPPFVCLPIEHFPLTRFRLTGDAAVPLLTPFLVCLPDTLLYCMWVKV